MNRLDTCFANCRAQGRKALIGYLTAGDPNPEASLEILAAACDAGVDILELGVPFSDPTADGPVIQAASGRALDAGMNLAGVLALTRRLRARTETPLVLFSYYNPILQYGPARLHAEAREAGIDGLLIVDLPPEEAPELTAQWPEPRLPLIRLLAPTTPPERIQRIVADAGGFLYLITRTGVTGEGGLDPTTIGPHAESLRRLSDLPVALGFGVRDAGDVAALAPLADGVVVGSALVRQVAQGGEAGAIAARVAATIRALRVPLDVP